MLDPTSKDVLLIKPAGLLAKDAKPVLSLQSYLEICMLFVYGKRKTKKLLKES